MPWQAFEIKRITEMKSNIGKSHFLFFLNSESKYTSTHTRSRLKGDFSTWFPFKSLKKFVFLLNHQLIYWKNVEKKCFELLCCVIKFSNREKKLLKNIEFTTHTRAHGKFKIKNHKRTDCKKIFSFFFVFRCSATRCCLVYGMLTFNRCSRMQWAIYSLHTGIRIRSWQLEAQLVCVCVYERSSSSSTTTKETSERNGGITVVVPIFCSLSRSRPLFLLRPCARCVCALFYMHKPSNSHLS